MKLSKTLLTLSSVAIIASNLLADEIIEPTGLNQIKDIIENDERLNKRVSKENIAKANESIDAMNALIKEAIIARALANDGVISISDTKEINRYLVENHLDKWYELRGESAGADSTGYYLVQKKGSQTIAMNANAVNIWGQIYNLGFESTNKNRLSDYSGSKSGSFSNVGYYLGEILKNDIATGELYNSEYAEVKGITNTELDSLVEYILNDTGLNRKVATEDIREGAKSADEMNKLIIEAIVAKGLANDKRLTASDIRDINSYLVKNHKELWAELHGDDENNEESGFHLVQNDGAYARIFADNVVNSVADGIYHLGFFTDNKNRLLNEDGAKNKSFEKVAWWLDTILRSDLESGKLNNADYKEVIGESGTSLDSIISYIYNDEGLLLKVSTEDIREGAKSANEMNKLIVEAIKATSVASDDFISSDEIATLNEYLVTNYALKWAEFHGDDENDEESGYHRIQNDGAIGYTYSRNTINNLADGLYHLGFATPYKNRLANEDGAKNVSFRNVSYWLNRFLAPDYEKGVFK